ncbi:hypothetical protein L9G15_04995 [Shewanella sp. A3A]|nr:hypothetical protein [Shewanella ferrihydritica]
MSFNNRFTTMTEVLTAVANGTLGNASLKGSPEYFDVYWCGGEDTCPTLNDEVYVGEPAEVADDVADDDYDEALKPAPVRARGWELAYSGEVIEDVVYSASQQLAGEVDNDTLLKALRYYWQHDCFFDFSAPQNNVATLV